MESEATPGSATEQVFALSPFTIRRKVRWADCDPAGVVYAPRFFDYGVSAMELWFEHLFEAPLCTGKNALRIRTPLKRASATFHAVLRPDEFVDIYVFLTKASNRTITLLIRGMKADLTLAFELTLVPVCVAKGEWRAVPWPQELRVKFDDYITREEGTR